ncbi:MAG: helix-turn-helix domain-containing protein [bacterium]|nr:helix-turn-helix domain-containing protein [bacterium]
MVDFRKKTIGPKDAFGSIFRRRREEMGMTLGTAAKQTGVPRHYLSALEEGRYGELPGFVYGKSFVRVYGSFLGLSVAPLLRAFVDEYTLVRATRSIKKQSKVEKSPFIFITPFRVRCFLAGALVLVLAVYMGGELVRFVRPPTLTIMSPEDQLITNAPTVQVAGSVDPNAVLTVNDVAVNNEEGNFSVLVPITVGVNTINVRASRRHGKETAVVRNVIRNASGISLK